MALTDTASITIEQTDQILLLCDAPGFSLAPL